MVHTTSIPVTLCLCPDKQDFPIPNSLSFLSLRMGRWCYLMEGVNTSVMSVILLAPGRWTESELHQQRYHFGYSLLLSILLSLLFYPSLLHVEPRFSPAQAELYEGVLEVQKACLSLCSPGASLDHIYSTMLALLGRQLKQLGIVKGSTSDADTLKVRSVSLCPSAQSSSMVGENNSRSRLTDNDIKCMHR